MGAVGIFVYVGAEVAIGSMLVNYMSQPNIGNISVQLAAKFVSLYWGGAMLGRFIGSAVLQKVRTGTVLGFSALMAFLLVALSMGSFGHLAMWSILLVGFFNSTMFPSIFTLSIEGLGPLTGKGSAVAGLRHRRRRDNSRAAGRTCRPYRHPSRVYPARAVLSLHSVFRVQE